MRKFFFVLGWAILIILPAIFAVEAYMLQDIPPIQAWKWAVPILAILFIIFARNRDSVIQHHLPH